MTERSVFLALLEIDDPAERAAYLECACAGDPVLRAQVEQLLTAHEESGSFMGQPAPDRLAVDLAAQTPGDATRTGPGAGDDGEGLDFLTPSDKPGVLGRLAHYEVLEVVGRGGMGVVLRAFDEKLHRVVAVKVMAAQLATSAAARKRFTREAQAQAAVSHDHVVTIHAVEEANGLPYLVMQYVSGLSLQERLDRGGPLQPHEVLRIGMQTAAGLAAAHAQGLVHRDVKPANILLENGVERVQVTDFGLARAASEASLTQSGVVAGTPRYMSPEQAEGKAIDQRSDLFSLGSVLYAMCTGRAPFRASGSMAVLKRVCEETPTPIRETNPEVPEWLVAIIDKLHAKDPAGRYQSAAEVAQLLSQHLAHVQHPSIVPLPPLPPLGRGAGSEGLSHARRRRWAMAAAALLVCLLGGMGLTEAAGVTQLRATVLRIFTPDGTLVVEIDDPQVKVMVEGDGGLVITGAGLEEIRLRPGSYKVHADRDGKKVPLERELVRITRGGREVVKVKLETAPAAMKAEKGAFVLLGGTGVAERKFDTLREAVQGASDGDTIEVRGNGPFVSKPIKIANSALTIRSGTGFRPVIRSLPESVLTGEPLLHSTGPLTLEGLEFQRLDRKAWNPDRTPYIIFAGGSSLHVANCRFRSNLPDPTQRYPLDCIDASTPVCSMRNCEFLDTAEITAGTGSHRMKFVMNNCVHVGRFAMSAAYGDPSEGGAEFVLSRNTVLTGAYAAIYFGLGITPDRLQQAPAAKPTNLQATSNIFDAGSVFQVGVAKPADKAEALFRRVVAWKGRDNLYARNCDFLRLSHGDKGLPYQGPRNLEGWRKFWNSPEPGSIAGAVRYQGGDLFARLAQDPEKLTPDDFRLRPDSAGYRAGEGGKDLGADVDLVGPGPAYERWKRTPEYQQWLKETGQVKK